MWKNLNLLEMQIYDWVLLGYYDYTTDNMAWQIGRKISDNKLEFWGNQKSGPYAGDSFFKLFPETITHWMPVPECIDGIKSIRSIEGSKK